MKSKLSVLSVALVAATGLRAQVSAYSFSQSIVSYGPPTTGTVISTPLAFDDVINTALPFSFTFNSTTYSSVNVCSNGYLSFNSITGAEYTPVSDATTSQLLSPYGNLLVPACGITGDITAGSNTITNCSSVAGYSVGDLLFDLNGDFGSDPTITAISGNNIVVNLSAISSAPGSDIVAYGTITKAVSGTAPNRVFEIEYRHMSRIAIFADAMYGEVLDFKVRLYETTNRIEFLYKLVTGPEEGSEAEIGLKGSSNADFNTREVTGGATTWSNSIAATTNTAQCVLNATLYPVAGQMYAWTPAACTTPTLSVTQTPSTTCPGFPAVLAASGASSYTWTGGPSSAQYTVSPSSTTSYTLTGATDICTATLVVTHSVIPGPTLSISSSNNSLCAGSTATLTASGATSFTWAGGPQTAAYAINPSSTSVYTVTGSNGGFCSALLTYTQNVTPLPVLGISQSSTTICPGQNAVLTATGASTYSWSTGAAVAQITVNPLTTSTYTVRGNNQSCTATATIVQNVAVCTTIADAGLSTALTAYPNPFRNQVTLKNENSADIEVSLSDALGKTVFKGKISGNSQETIDLSALNNGMYLLQLNGAGQSQTRKLVKAD